MTTLDIKNLTTKEMVELKENLEKEIAFREDIGREIKQQEAIGPPDEYKQQEAIERLKAIRNYPDGALAYSITRNP
ncbi:MAG: hypothetical protein CXT73_01845 [Methanobacteriota archaeon]|jgi:hypothetical protein|nr:MAG: hypothetical protein CXT73_01845 [Euryarchaeota archaeon]|tara:strand:+ start:808 stop:1035 length:228 start_codon:yes stop_codon:yes gene_type:complete